MEKKLWMMAALLTGVLSANAQKSNVADRELIGVWVMQSMQWDGEKNIVCGKENGYTQVKYYGADGEYACAEIVLNKKGNVVVLPHEYGTYTFKDGVYTEMGRPTTPDALVLTDKNTFKGRWNRQSAIWKKQNTLPDGLVKHIVNSCKLKEMPANLQQQAKQHLFK